MAGGAPPPANGSRGRGPAPARWKAGRKRGCGRPWPWEQGAAPAAEEEGSSPLFGRSSLRRSVGAEGSRLRARPSLSVVVWVRRLRWCPAADGSNPLGSYPRVPDAPKGPQIDKSTATK